MIMNINNAIMLWGMVLCVLLFVRTTQDTCYGRVDFGTNKKIDLFNLPPCYRSNPSLTNDKVSEMFKQLCSSVCFSVRHFTGCFSVQSFAAFGYCPVDFLVQNEKLFQTAVRFAIPVDCSQSARTTTNYRSPLFAYRLPD
jgi:hypothetical protein